MTNLNNSFLANFKNKLNEMGHGDKPLPHLPRPELPEAGLALTLNQQWTSIIWSIDTAEVNGIRALNGLTVALARIIQADILQRLTFDARQSSSSNRYTIEDFLWGYEQPIRADGKTIKNLLKVSKSIAPVDMTFTAVIPEARDQWRLIRSLQDLGKDAERGQWQQTDNLYAVAWTPWPIVWVSNGNHSTLAAIVTHGGMFTPSESFDAKELLLSVYTDGQNWLRVDNDQVIAPVVSLPMAAIFEIGRRLIKAPKTGIK